MASALVPVALGMVALGGLAFLASDASADEGNVRSFWLIQGKRYAIAHRITGPGVSADMYPGFCNFSEFTLSSIPGAIGGEAQFTAEWCAPNRQWDVPSEVAIVEV